MTSLTMKEQEYIAELKKAAEMIGQARFDGFQEGIENERNRWVDALLPQSVEITIRVRGQEKELEMVRRIITFEEIKSSHLKALRYGAEDMVIEIATKGKLIPPLLT